MATTKLGLPTITGNMTADVVRDMNALAEAVDGKAGVANGLAMYNAEGKVVNADGSEAGEVTQAEFDGLAQEVTTHVTDDVIHITAAERSVWNAKLSTTDLKDASTSQKGIVQLNNTVTSTSTTQAATANAVKQAYDKAVSVESAGLRLIIGTYAGDGTQDRTIFIGATPKLVFVFQVASAGDMSRMFIFNSIRGAMLINQGNNVAGGYLSNMKTVTNGFFLSKTEYLNNSGDTYHYYALI